tara:strand:+ start:78 stop:1445 length:1368 start_codon:yes stop_codon:yes gene_type:complete
MATTYLTKSISSTGTNTKGTYSGWIKRSDLTTNYPRFFAINTDANRYLRLFFHNDDKLHLYIDNGSGIGQRKTTRVFRDTSAWYHIVVAIDSLQGTASDRIKVWVNGVQETTFDSTINPAQGANMMINNSGTTFVIGRHESASSDYFNGSMSHVHWIDGTAYDASAFGSTDSTTGEWKINTAPNVTYGTNGFFILKDGNSVTDASTNSNNFTVYTGASGSLTKTEDCPSNVFCTGNPLARYGGNLTYSQGNNTITSGSGWFMGSSTLGASEGKYYYEYKITTLGTGGGYHKLGFISNEAVLANNTGHIAESGLDGAYAFYCQNGNLEVRTDDAVISGYDISTLGISFSNNDIMCVAVDMDNKRAYFRKNDGAWIKSADPVNGTNGLDISSDYTAGKCMIPAFASYYNGVGSLNFGNGYFGTTQVSSAGTNASGNGIFEYDVPTGYTALSTKGLNL